MTIEGVFGVASGEIGLRQSTADHSASRRVTKTSESAYAVVLRESQKALFPSPHLRRRTCYNRK